VVFDFDIILTNPGGKCKDLVQKIFVILKKNKKTCRVCYTRAIRIGGDYQ
jgi:hypothetical protein